MAESAHFILTNHRVDLRFDLPGVPFVAQWTARLHPRERDYIIARRFDEKSAAMNFVPPPVMTYYFMHATRPNGQFRRRMASAKIALVAA